MGGRLIRALRPRIGGVAAKGCPLETNAHAAKRSRLDHTNSKTTETWWLLLLPEEQVKSILSYLDLATFALAVTPSCQWVSGLVGCDSFEGWFHEIKNIFELCPWAKKQSFDKVIEAIPGLQMHQYRSVLKELDRDFVTSGMRILPQSSRSPGVVAVPEFFDCPPDTLVFACKACGSFLSPVSNTVGHGTMGQQMPAFILQPRQSSPFCCGLYEQHQMCLSSGMYVLQDLACPNANCDADLGWKYQECVPVSGHVPPSNLHKIGQFWMYAEMLAVVSPCSELPSIAGEQFYFMSAF